ncbi:hypothetical protein BC833DRAFT_588366 [Globomyces pollinis-pini]|nr:hypothetical protein BC833DRAFT_588366 [Globomyces pollinis-pini]
MLETELVQTIYLNESQKIELLDLLVDAFKDQPFKCALDPLDTREYSSRWLLEKRIALYGDSSWTLLSGEKVIGHVCLNCPGNEDYSFLTLVYHGFLLAPYMIGWTVFSRLNASITKFKKPKRMESYWTINLVAIDKQYRGKGLGKNLMNSIMEKLPSDVTVHLDTQLDTNVAFYKSLGFNLVHEQDITLVDSTFHSWTLIKNI